jgi:hypothetical protein
MNRYTHMVALAALLSFGFGAGVSMAAEPRPAEEKEKKDMNGGKATEDQTKDQKKEMGGK